MSISGEKPLPLKGEIVISVVRLFFKRIFQIKYGKQK